MDTSLNADDDDETLAFRFAAALLAPADHVYRELRGNTRHLSWGVLQVLKRKYGLSMSAWVRRAYDLELISYSEYKAMNIEYKTLGWHKREPVQYLADEEPLQLKQMVGRATAEGLVAPDKYSYLQLEDADSDENFLPRGEYPSASDLLAMDQEDRQRWISQMFEWAKDIDFEVFEAFGEEEF